MQDNENIKTPAEETNSEDLVETTDLFPDETEQENARNAVFALRDVAVELGEIRKWFSQTDYIPNKIVVGEWEETDERWISYKEERIKKRARQDEIMKQLTSTFVTE